MKQLPPSIRGFLKDTFTNRTNMYLVGTVRGWRAAKLSPQAFYEDWVCIHQNRFVTSLRDLLMFLRSRSWLRRGMRFPIQFRTSISSFHCGRLYWPRPQFCSPVNLTACCLERLPASCTSFTQLNACKFDLFVENEWI